MERPPTLSRLFPEAAAPGHNEDNGALLELALRALPADKLHTAAAASRALARAAGSATARATVGTASTVAAAPVKIAARRFPGVVRIRVLVVRLFEPVG